MIEWTRMENAGSEITREKMKKCTAWVTWTDQSNLGQYLHL